MEFTVKMLVIHIFSEVLKIIRLLGACEITKRSKLDKKNYFFFLRKNIMELMEMCSINIEP